MHVADLMTRKVITVGLGSSVRHAADLMLNHRISGLPVVDDAGLLAGLVTEGDLLRRAELGVPDTAHPWQAATSPAGLTRDFVKRNSWRVSDVMTSPVTTVSEFHFDRRCCSTDGRARRQAASGTARRRFGRHHQSC